MHKIYCFNNGGTPGLLHAVALREDGVFMADHCCSHKCFMRHDLGVDGTWKHEIYQRKCPDGFVVEWVNDPATHAGCRKAIELANAAPPSNAMEDRASATFTMDDGSTTTVTP